MREERLFNDNWRFAKAPLGSSPTDEFSWTDVEIPHDWLIYDTNDLYETGEGWYVKTFYMDFIPSRKFSVRFEGVYMDSTVYVNKNVVGEWKYGYSTFEFDITDYLKVGENEIMVRVVHQSPNSRWYSGAGVYRNVWLIKMGYCRIVPDGVYVSTTKLEDRKWLIEVETEGIFEGQKLGKAKGRGAKPWKEREITVRHTVMDRLGNIRNASQVEVMWDGEPKKVKQVMEMSNPNIWDVDRPYLYRLKTEVISSGHVIDEVACNFGFRTIDFDCNKGFQLNGRRIKLNGACQHHDLGALGAAVNKAALRRQMSILKEMGVNAIRTAHNMPAVDFMDLADEMGILVVSEAFDVWERSKTQYDYARFFQEWHERDVASWVRRDRNHPSLILWSIGNEIYDTHAGKRGKEVAIALRELVKVHDPNGNGWITFGSNYMPWENTQDCAHEIPVVGYNYAEYLYEEHHKKYPNWILYGSETASTVQSRGIYHFPLSQPMLSNEDEQCSSLGNCTTSWGAKSTAQCIIDDRDAAYSLGQFIWSGTDYIGEPTPYHTKNSYFGQIDTAGFPKDSFYMFQAEWTDYKEKPMIHILPYWDFNEGQTIDVRAYSNAPKMELFFNGESLGTYEIDHKSGRQLSGDCRIAYRPGVIRAVAYDEEGNVLASDERRSFTDAAELVLETDKDVLQADGRDLIFLTITTKDKDGNYVENANNRVFVKVGGAGRLIGLDNGNSADFEQYKGTNRKLFSGKLLAIIAAKHEAGDIRVEASSVGMDTKTLTLQAVECDSVPGTSTHLMENVDKDKPNDPNEVPIRKIALTRNGSGKLNKEYDSVPVKAETFPENATHSKLEWKVTDHAGNDSYIVDLEMKSEKEVLLTAKGDGECRLRCFARNGSRRVEVISELEFTVEGIGKAYLNPYRFIAGGLYNASNGELTNGNERGVATLRDKVSHVGFRNLDFGEFGSDELTIPIFHMSNDPLHFEIWEGMPGEEGSELLLNAEYNHPSIWNVYQEETFRLPRRVKGVTTICFVFHLKVHIKGFSFKYLNQAYERLRADENSRISGDSYRIEEDAIEGIGNNVAIEYDRMNFERGIQKIEICGRSHIEVNTIHVRFRGTDGDVNQVVEFPYSEDYVTKEFPLENVVGERKVLLVFLPGSEFDLKWFRFH